MLFCKCLYFFGLIFHISVIQYDSEHSCITSVFKVLYCFGNVICRIECHLLSRCHDQNFFRIVFPDRRCESAADHVPEYVIQNDIGLIGLE